MELSQHLALKKKKKICSPNVAFQGLVFQRNLITQRLLLSGLCGSQPHHARVTAEVSLRLMIMNYAEGHIPLVTSHLHSLPLDCLAGFNFFFPPKRK